MRALLIDSLKKPVAIYERHVERIGEANEQA